MKMKTVELLNYPVCQSIGVLEMKGNLFGIELELEGAGVGLRDVATRGWDRHQEPSLRGEAIEYTTAGPKTLENCQKLVTELFKKFEENKVKFNDSVRTSTHVHLNFSDKPLKQAINFFTLFTVFEEVLQYYSGEDRKGNLFCMSTRDAEAIVGVLSRSLSDGTLISFSGDRYKYGACNLSCLYKFGTLEVRTMRGANSSSQVNRWLEILNDLYEYSLRMESPVKLVTDLSHLGAEGFMASVFKPDNRIALMKTFPVVRDLHESLMEGARVIQMFAYEFEDVFREKIELKEGPKGTLPIKIQVGPHRGMNYTIWRPDGEAWNVVPKGALPGQMFWVDGQQVYDDNRIEWNEERQRFIVRYPNEEIYECRWMGHHELAEPRPAAGARRAMPRLNLDEELEVEGWHDEDEEEIPDEHDF